MNRLILVILLISGILGISGISFSQNVNLSGAVSGNGTYATLADAFSVINGSVQTSANINLDIIGNTTEPATGSILNAGVWTSLKIQPSGGSAKTISGTVDPGLPMLDFNGSDNVTIDGLNSGGNSLTITNISSSSLCTIRFKSDATYSLVTRCSILGSAVSNVFIDGNSSSTGNDYITISYCDIGPVGINLPRYGVSIVGTSNSIANNGDTIRNCNIHDYFENILGSTSSGIYIGGGTSDITIKENRFYQTAGRSHVDMNDPHFAIAIQNTSGNNYDIFDNIIGHSSETGTGYYSIIGQLNYFAAIYLNVDTTSASSIQGNIIRAINYQTNRKGSYKSAPCMMIFIDNGLVNVGDVSGNTIGSQTSGSAITFTSGAHGEADFNAIGSFGNTGFVCSNNTIGDIIVESTFTGYCDIYGISVDNSSENLFICENNTIGGSVSGSITNFSSTGRARIIGINCFSSVGYISNNVIRNLSAGGGSGTLHEASISGISVNGYAASGHNIKNNSVYSLRNLHPNSATIINGIYFKAADGLSVVSGNFVHSILMNSPNGIINGIYAYQGSADFQNNMVRLGIDEYGNSNDAGITINGIYEKSSGHNFYFNSIYIGGSVNSSSSNSYAFFSSETSEPREYKNNIFYNARSSTGSQGKNYGVSFGGNTYNPTGLKSNYNDIYVSGIGGVFGYFNGNDISDLDSWISSVGQDYSSLSDDPKFLLPNGNSATVDLHINSGVSSIIEGNGKEIPGIALDFDGELRNTLSPVDIGADAGNFIQIVQDYKIELSGALDNNGYYKNINSAFSAVNDASQTGADLIISIKGNTTESNLGANLYSGLWSSLLIRPEGGESRVVSGTTSPGYPMINLNGADNVTIDGNNLSGDSLTISNQSISSVSGTCTILFQNDATYNKITNCRILGSSTVAHGQNNTGGVISFGNSLSSSSSGNDFNVISNCNIGPAGMNLPVKCINFSGTTSTDNANNSGDTIKNCNIYDFFSPTKESGGIYVSKGNQLLSFIDNRFYQTSVRTITANDQFHTVIDINSSNGNNTTRNGFLITGNIIGFSNPYDSGYYSITSVDNPRFTAISTYVDNVTPASNIQGNIIKNISISGDLKSNGLNSEIFKGIYISRGLVNVGDVTGNIIGSQEDTGSINFYSTSTSVGDVKCIYNKSSIGNWICFNNKIGGISLINNSGGALKLECINSSISSSLVFNCRDNIIGGDSLNSIQNVNSNLNYIKSLGIIVEGSSSYISGNIIRNMSTSATGQYSPASIAGIYILSSSADQTITGNEIHSIRNNHTLLKVNSNVTGIYFSGSFGTNLIEKNNIHNLIIENQNSIIRGIHIAAGNTTCKNNMIQIGSTQDGSNIEMGAGFYGINETGGSNNFYFNSVFIGGTATGGDGDTYAFLSSVTNSTRNYINNVFYNSRSSNISLGKHYAIGIGGSVPNPTGLNIQNNVFYVDGLEGYFGKYNSTDISDLSGWQSAVGQDANSYFDNPHFLNPNGSYNTADLHINPSLAAVVNSNGIDIPSVTDDFDSELRSDLTPVDIGADAGIFTAYYANDIAVESVWIDNQIILSGKSYTVNTKIRNIGSDPQSSIPIYYNINNGALIGPVYSTGTLNYFETQNILFDESLSFSPVSSGQYNLKVFSSLASDDQRSNDTLILVANAVSEVSALPFVETFSNLANWSVNIENPVDTVKLWELGLSTNPAGVEADVSATSNCYFGAAGRVEILSSPPINLSNFKLSSIVNIPVLSFYVSYTGYSGLNDSMEVLLSTDNGSSFFNAATVYNKSRTSDPSLATRNPVFTEYFPDSSIQWRHEFVNLQNVSGDTSVIIGFRAKSDSGNRIWVDNVIVNTASSYNSQIANSAGLYDFDRISIHINSFDVFSNDATSIEKYRHLNIEKFPRDTKKIVGQIPISNKNIFINKDPDQDSHSSMGNNLTVIEYPVDKFIPSFISPTILENDTISGSTTGDGSRFTPISPNSDVNFSVTYEGNDQNGYVNYDVRIDASELSSVLDINKIYILKRADMTAQWECLNTTVSGDTLIATGLNTFCDFSISSSKNALTLNLKQFIEGFYNPVNNFLVKDTVRVYLRNKTTPYQKIDSAISYTDSTGFAKYTFFNSGSDTTFYIQVSHRNSIDTWSKTVQSFSASALSYDFTSSNTQAFGDNQIQVDTSPLRYAIYSGDVNKDGTIDLNDASDVDNDSYNFVSGYLPTDVNGDGVSDLSDAVFVDNNLFNFISEVTP